jgi:hypothetical protein
LDADARARDRFDRARFAEDPEEQIGSEAGQGLALAADGGVEHSGIEESREDLDSEPPAPPFGAFREQPVERDFDLGLELP